MVSVPFYFFSCYCTYCSVFFNREDIEVVLVPGDCSDNGIQRGKKWCLLAKTELLK